MKKSTFSWCLLPSVHAFSLRLPGLIFFETAAALTALRQQGVTEIFCAAVLELSLLFLSDADIKHQIIPRKYLIAPVICNVASMVFSQGLFFALLGMGDGLALAAAVWLISLAAHRGFGGGDIRLFALAGLYLGLRRGLFCVLLSCVIGLVTALVKRRSEFPLGPSISISIVICLIVFP